MTTINSCDFGTGTAGQVLTSNGANVAPTFQPVTSAGTIIQVVSSTFTATSSNSSNVFADTGLTVTITPSSIAHKILVFASISTYNGAGNTSTFLNLVRDATNILLGDAASSRTQVTCCPGVPSTGFGQDYACMHYLDSPASVAALTYKIQFASPTNTDVVYVNQGSTDTDAASTGRSASVITVMEVV